MIHVLDLMHATQCNNNYHNKLKGWFIYELFAL